MHYAFARDPARRLTSLEILLKVEKVYEDPGLVRYTQREPLEECVFGDNWPGWM